MDKEKEKAAKGVDSVTDFVKENEVDNAQAEASLKAIQSNMQIQQNISIAPEDIARIADECEITNIAAEQLLRKYGGQTKDALRAFIKGEA
jgi:hypothetical protein